MSEIAGSAPAMKTATILQSFADRLQMNGGGWFKNTFSHQPKAIEHVKSLKGTFKSSMIDTSK